MTRGFKSLQSKLKRAQRRVPDEVEGTVRDETKATVREAKRHISTKDVTASGQLLASFYYTERVGDSGGTKISIGNNAPYAKYVEYGTGSYFGISRYPIPPEITPYKSADFSTDLIEALMQWARVKPTLTPQIPLRVFAVKVARNIDERGTKPSPFWRPAVDTNMMAMKAGYSFRKELRRVFK